MLDLLVNIEEFDADAALIRNALALASRQQAFLTGLQLVPEYFPPAEAAACTDDPEDRPSAAQARRQWWMQRCGHAGVAGEWEVRHRLHVDALAKRSQLADFVIGRLRAGGADGDSGYDEVIRALFAPSSPMLLLPDRWQGVLQARRVVIAWNGSGTVARAVKAALPLLQRAAAVHVLDGERRGLPGITLPPLPLRAWLQRHGVDAQWENFEGDPGAGRNLLDRAHQLDADLLVVGAWGRLRITELILGGATRWLLEHASLPLFIAH
ncbi:MAG: universal stress protein [Pseudomonadota bacterium]|jgi:nucleotide-binding universal stress UspA family protein|nr:universal stress protein [Xanthomonadaceae bacterium]MDE2247430.1 universal stress protein [Xanthomonadaceae bacterium]MDE3210270.1 universal stress protein [Pseudomonadota bacterium]